MPKTEFDTSRADKNVAAALEQHERKATQPLRCAPFVEDARATVVILAQWRVLRKLTRRSLPGLMGLVDGRLTANSVR